MALQVMRLIAASTIGVAILLALATTSADVDLWGHVRFGLDTLDQRRVDESDPYSFTSDRPWINHEWLAEVVFAAAWRAAGTPGLIAVKLATAAGAVWFVRQTLILRAVGSDVRLMLLGLTLAGILPRLVHVRPQLFSVLLFSVLTWVFARVEGGRRWTLAVCPPLLMLWTNVHGGWITGLGALGLWTLGDAWNRRENGLRALDGAAWTAASAAATLLNPYGIGLWSFLAATVRFGRESIGEWGPIWSEPTAPLAWVLFALMTIAAVRSTGLSRLGTRLIQPVFWGLASLKVVRLDAFFVLSVTGFLGPAIERFLGRGRSARPGLPLLFRAITFAGILALSFALPFARRTVTCIPMHARWWPEPAALEFIRANGLSGRMLTFYRWGEYALWYLSPSIKVSMDGRRETVYSDQMVSGHLQFYAGMDDGLTFVDGLQADYAWVPANLPGAHALRQRGWIPVFEGEQSLILAPRSTEQNVYVQPVALRSAVTRCFPGP